MAILLRIYAHCGVFLQGGGVLKVANIRFGVGDVLLNWRHDREPSGRSFESSTRDRTTSLLCGSGSQDSTHFFQIVLLPIPQPWPMITSQDHKIQPTSFKLTTLKLSFFQIVSFEIVMIRWRVKIYKIDVKFREKVIVLTTLICFVFRSGSDCQLMLQQVLTSHLSARL